jgi:hypothetical protein
MANHTSGSVKGNLLYSELEVVSGGSINSKMVCE